MTEFFKIILGLVAFIAGAGLVVSGLKSIDLAAWLRHVENPWPMFAVALGVTVVAQSSSITTAGLVLLVGADAISLPTAIAGVLGANVGTSATAWVASLAPGVSVDGQRLAAVHTGVNLAMAMVFIWLTPSIARLAVYLIPGRE